MAQTTTICGLQDVEIASGQHGPGVVIPAQGLLLSLADTDAPNNSLYYSTTQTALAYKDPSGTVHTITTS